MSEKIAEFVIYGNPFALKRHRTVRTDSGKNINYDPSSGDKTSFAWKAISKFKPKKPFNEPLMVKFIFYMPRPKNHYGTGKNKDVLKSSAPKFHTVKPDIDNLEKFLLDSLNGIYWRDDSIISTLIARKIYTEDPPKTEITIKYDSLT